MLQPTINRERCTGCGACADECQRGLLIVENGCAGIVPEKICMDCGHCAAICPADAIRFSGKPEEELIPYDPAKFDISADKLLNTMKFRRSVRHFTGEPVSDEDIRLLLDAGRYAPTGRNREANRFVVIRDTLDEVTRRALYTLREMAKVDYLPQYESFRDYHDRWMTMYDEYLTLGKDRLFHGAPCVICVIAHKPEESGVSRLDAGLAAANIELLTHTLGLGTCYIGFFAFAVNEDPDLAGYLELGPEDDLVATLAIGHPSIRFQRTVNRHPANVVFK